MNQALTSTFIGNMQELQEEKKFWVEFPGKNLRDAVLSLENVGNKSSLRLDTRERATQNYSIIGWKICL